MIEAGPWLVGRRVLLPARLISDMSPDDETIASELTKDQIKDSPTFDPDLGDITCQQHRDEVADYFKAFSDR